MGLIEAIVLAFLGGMLLNLMPCVLPVLAVKVTALASMGDDSRKKRLRHGLGYSAGIVASMLVLAMVVIGLQALGQSVGWGFQFQQPWFIVVLASVMVLFALNLFGVYQIGVPAGASKLDQRVQTGDRRSFFEGVLAVVLATPCTAPFMGTAVGFAMTSHPMVIVSVFVSLGLGLAAPFVAVALVPAFTKIIPSPGAWMGIMKKGLGFALLLTALWLVWLFGRVVEPEAMIGLLGFLIALSFAGWVYGEVQYRAVDTAKIFALTMAVAAIGLGGWMGLDVGVDESSSPRVETDQPPNGEPTLVDGQINWQSWSESTIDDALADHRPVFVNFTADWCITCKANEREIISTSEVMEAADEAGVLMVKADLTNTDDELIDEMERFDRSGVPLYLVYDPASPDDPKVLPQVISQDRLIDEFSAL